MPAWAGPGQGRSDRCVLRPGPTVLVARYGPGPLAGRQGRHRDDARQARAAAVSDPGRGTQAQSPPCQ